MADPRVNQIRIKTGVLKRLVKEKICYEKEFESEKCRLKKMEEENKDSHDINKQIINETVMLLPDCQKRIIAAYDDLQRLVKESELDLSENEIFSTAKTLLQEVNV